MRGEFTPQITYWDASWLGYVSAWPQERRGVQAGGNDGSCASEESTDDSYLSSPRHIEQWKNLKKSKSWKKWKEGLLRRVRKAFKTCVAEYDDEERMAWDEWKMHNEECLKLNEEWAVHRMVCLLKETLEPVQGLLTVASRAAKKKAEEAQGGLRLICEYVYQQLENAIFQFGTGDSVHKTVNQLVDVLVLVQETMDVCQKQGSEFLIEITERNQGPLHEAVKTVRDSFILRLSLTVSLGNYTAWDEALGKAFKHHPDVLEVERSKLYNCYERVMNSNFRTLGFMAFDSTATAIKANGKKKSKRKRKKAPSHQTDPYGELCLE